MTDKDLLGYLLDIYRAGYNIISEPMGIAMFKLYTQFSFPPDMFINELERRIKLEKDSKAAILSTYQIETTKHQIKSGIGEKRLEKIRVHNNNILKNFIEKGEIDIY